MHNAIFCRNRNDLTAKISMAILTDGPALEPLDKWSSAYIQQIEAAHQHQLLVNAAAGLALFALVLVVIVAGPRLWRRARAHLAGPVRMPDLRD